MNLFEKFTLATALGLGLSANAQFYQYILEPGSTITPTFGIFPQGPSEPLSGSFTWHLVSSDANQYNFNTSALSFNSQSYSLTLNPSPYNSATAVSINMAYFVATVNTTGLPFSQMEFVAYPYQGTYEGPASAPTRLLFGYEYLTAVGGGTYRAHVNFSAILVPEPSGVMFMAVTCFGLLLRPRLCRAGQRRTAT